MTNPHPGETAILIVDDEVSLRNTFRIFLSRAGYGPVITVASFEEAVKVVSTRMFDLIICDIVLESHSGIELLKRFRQLGIACPVVIVTGYPHVETASEAVRLGAFDYLAKPVEKDALLKTARLALSHYQLEKEKSKAELAREQYRSFLETIFKSVSDSIISVDQNLCILKMNQAATALFQSLQPEVQEGGSLNDLCGNKDLCRIVTEIVVVLQANRKATDFRLECFLDGACKVLSCCISPLRESDRDAAGAVLVIRDITQKEKQYQERTQFHRMIGASVAMQNVYRMIENIGKVDTSVLITGESGTGKELAVHALHLESPRRNQPLIMVDCTTISDNLLESELFGHKKGSFTGADENRLGRILQAEGGTLFLDEIGNIPITMQLRLLRFLQEKTFYPVGRDKEVQVDVRIIAATNIDLKEKVKNGSFREDLYFRLLIIDIHLPPLRERKGDIILLTRHFIEHFAEKLNKSITGISEQAQSLLCHYRWPGNVRQLEHAIERAGILCEGTTISTEHLPQELLLEQEAPQFLDTESSLLPGETVSHDELACHYSLSKEEQKAAEKILTALKKSGGNKAKAARFLRIDRSTLYRKMRELHIDMNIFGF